MSTASLLNTAKTIFTFKRKKKRKKKTSVSKVDTRTDFKKLKKIVNKIKKEYCMRPPNSDRLVVPRTCPA